MVSEIAKTLLDFLKLAPRLLAALGITAGLLLFSSNQVLKHLGLVEFTQKWRFGIGLTLVVSIALLVAHGSAHVFGRMKRWWQRRKSDNHLIERLHQLTEDEKQILRYYLARQTRANMLRIENGVVQALASEGIIYRATIAGDVLEGFAHNISDLAWNYLNLHPELLDGSTNTYYTDQRQGFRM